MINLVHGKVTGGGQIELELWAALAKRKDNKMPDMSRLLSLLTLRTLRKFDQSACTMHMFEVAQRVKGKGGITGRDSKVKGFHADIATGGGFRDARPVDAAQRYLGDVANQSGVAGAVANIKKSLDGGLMVHARVLSGVGVGVATKLVPDRNAKRVPQGIPLGGEHSVLIIGYDGNHFVFNDPDAKRSNSPERGFGELIFDGIRLTTARSETDLKVSTSGDHEPGRHRYQVLSLTSL
jgi:hypothetical protein